MKKLFYSSSLVIVISIIICYQGVSQELIPVYEKQLTHYKSAEDIALFHLLGSDFVSTDPPEGIVRNIAEFEQMEGVLIRYPFGISYDLIAGMSEEIMVTTIVNSESQKNLVSSHYLNNDVNMDNINFLIAPSDSYWSRDYGPWYIAYGDDEIGICDFIYNRPTRPNDNAIPQKLADELGIEWFGMDLITAGGNYMTTGYGTSAASDLTIDENEDLTVEKIDSLVLNYLGVVTNYMLPDPNNTYIDHIDCWGKFLDVDKVLIREVPEYHDQYEPIEETATFFEEAISDYGTPFEVYRVWTPNNQPYTNSLILNNRVFVPITGSSWDDEALASYEEAMPGYEVIGFTGSWQSTDALHCRTKGMADRNMLFIEHYPLLGVQPYENSYYIEAEITAYSGEAIYDDSVKVIYWIDGELQDEIIMNNEGDKLYSASIPSPDYDAEIAYIIHAADESGKSVDNPLIGEFDPHVFSFDYVTGIDGLINENIKANSYPNPFASYTTIELMVNDHSDVVLEIYNLSGKKVSTLFNGILTKGRHKFNWNGTDQYGSKVNSGVYYYRIQTGNERYSEKLVLLN